MYLTSSEIKARINHVIKDAEYSSHPFDENEQIRVCSIDLRVDSRFWKQRRLTKWYRPVPLDLGIASMNEISPRRLWTKVDVPNNGTIELKPGEMILGRTHEKICMPTDLVGKINTRSSYARIGLSTACNCDLVNPGYEGYVPLELTNLSPNSIIIHPHMSLCQLFLMPLTGDVDSSYASERYNSKYMDDDGGPSVWWRDKLVERIVANNLQSQITATVVKKILEKCTAFDDGGFDRLQKFVGSRKFDSPGQLLDQFGKSEGFKIKLYKAKNLFIRLTPLLVVPSILQIQIKLLTDGQSPDYISWSIWSLFLATLPLAIYNYFWAEKIEFYEHVRK